MVTQLFRFMVFNTTFNNILVISQAVNFIGGGNRNTWRKPLTYRKSLTNLLHNVISSTPCHEWDSNSQLSGDWH